MTNVFMSDKITRIAVIAYQKLCNFISTCNPVYNAE